MSRINGCVKDQWGTGTCMITQIVVSHDHTYITVLVDVLSMTLRIARHFHCAVCVHIVHK